MYVYKKCCRYGPWIPSQIGSRCTPLMLAAFKGQAAAVEALLAAGADTTTTSSCVLSPFCCMRIVPFCPFVTTVPLLSSVQLRFSNSSTANNRLQNKSPGMLATQTLRTHCGVLLLKPRVLLQPNVLLKPWQASAAPRQRK